MTDADRIDQWRVERGWRAALRFMSKSRRRWLGLFAGVLTAEDRELRPVQIDIDLAVLRDIGTAHPDRLRQVLSLMEKLEAAKDSPRR